MLIRHLDIPDEIYYKLVEYIETDDTTKEQLIKDGISVIGGNDE